jgi:hypothetical protein
MSYIGSISAVYPLAQSGCYITNGASYGSFIPDHEGSSSPPDPLSIAMERGRKLAEAKLQPLDVVPDPL